MVADPDPENKNFKKIIRILLVGTHLESIQAYTFFGSDKKVRI